MYRIRLSAAEQGRMLSLSRSRDIGGRERDRLEMIRLSDAGWSVPRIARHLGYCEQTVRRRFQAYLEEGFASLSDKPRPGGPRRVTEVHLESVEEMLATTSRTWTAGQLSTWLLEEFGVRVSASHLSRLLRQRHYRYKRTQTSVQHKANERQQQEKAAALAALEK